MRKPDLHRDCDNGDGTYDYEEFIEATDRYWDEKRDELIEKQWEEGDTIHQQRKDEKDEK